MQLRTNRLYLRPVALSDAADLFLARSDPVVMRYWDWPEQKSVSEVEEIIRAHAQEIRDGRTLWWVVATSAKGYAIGECDLSEIDRHHRRAEVGFLFSKANWGQGYALEAMRVVVDHAFETLGLERLWARCHEGNVASMHLLEKLGFACEGRLRSHILREGNRRDCLLYGRLK
jgi:ribosomal-protein-alanine N-acetyltransferase